MVCKMNMYPYFSAVQGGQSDTKRNSKLNWRDKIIHVNIVHLGLQMPLSYPFLFIWVHTQILFSFLCIYNKARHLGRDKDCLWERDAQCHLSCTEPWPPPWAILPKPVLTAPGVPLPKQKIDRQLWNFSTSRDSHRTK